MGRGSEARRREMLRPGTRIRSQHLWITCGRKPGPDFALGAEKENEPMSINLLMPVGRVVAVLGLVPLLLLRIRNCTDDPKLRSARMDAFSKLPDWSGLWRLKGSPGLLDVENGRSFTPGNRDHPPYKPDWETKYQVDLVRAEHQGDANYPNPLVDSHTLYCAAGMPRIIGTPFDYEFVVTPEATWIIVEKETRHIYTDGRGFPPEDELWPTLLGRSIGHWEGQTLVVETISVKSGLWADTTPAMLSEQARYIGANPANRCEYARRSGDHHGPSRADQALEFHEALHAYEARVVGGRAGNMRRPGRPKPDRQWPGYGGFAVREVGERSRECASQQPCISL